MSIIYKFLMYILYAILCVILPIVFSMIVWYIIYRIQGIKRKKGEYQYVGYGSFLKRYLLNFLSRKYMIILQQTPTLLENMVFI